MKLSRRTILTAAAALLLVIAGVAVAIVVAGRGPAPSSIVFSARIPDSVLPALNEELGTFRSLFPQTKLTFLPESTAGAATASGTEADVRLLNGYPDDLSQWVGQPSAWSGEVWVLAIRKKVIASADAETASALRDGSMTSNAFTAYLDKLKNGGQSPITLGNSHEWPFTMWIQTWTAMRLGPEKARQLPDAQTISSKDFTDILKELKTWRTDAWFDPTAWNQDWAKGLTPLADGKAAMALVNSQMLSALAPQTRQDLELLPLPQGGRASWSIGNVAFLAVSKKTKFPAEAAELVRFLTSPGVTGRLVTKTGLPFLSWAPRTSQGAHAAEAPTVLGAWAGRANEAGFQILVDAAK